jgi:hypothetical protein
MSRNSIEHRGKAALGHRADAQRNAWTERFPRWRRAEGHRRRGVKVPKPRRLPSTRTALTDVQLAAINHIVATTGNDPELNTLILRLHTETACRTVPGSGADFDIVLAPPQH